jgi:hypothetical protein
MSKATGLGLILTGLGLAAYAMPFHFRSNDSMTFAVETEAGKVRTSPTHPHVTASDGSRTQFAFKAQPSSAPPAAQPKGQDSSADLKGSGAVTSTQHKHEPAVRYAVAPQRPLPSDGVALARELQRELKRVVCYDGEINGAWTTAARKAMKAFTERVNASLPVEKPDYVLLTLVRAHQGQACGRACPTGQGAADDGRCVPNAILAQTAKKVSEHGWAVAVETDTRQRERSGPVITGWQTSTSAAASLASVPPLEGRMALSGPGGTLNEPRTVRPVAPASLAKEGSGAPTPPAPTPPRYAATKPPVPPAISRWVPRRVEHRGRRRVDATAFFRRIDMNR